MKLIKTIIPVLIIITGIYFSEKIYSQSCNTLNITYQSQIASTCDSMVMTMIHDENGLSYLYVANKEAGLKVYYISNITSPLLVAKVPTSMYDTLDVMNVTQSGNYLYLAIGNSFTNSTACGLAIVDVSNPESPSVTDYYVVPGSKSGGGIVKVEGNYAYLGAMQSGLVILDISDKSNIKFVSQYIPSIKYPPVTNPNPEKYNARGMEVRNSIVYLCYDAGGIRIINCTNKLAPVETGHWCNPAMYTPFEHPRAYNNCVLDDTLLYVATDYAGMEVLDVSDTSNIRMLGWWNPYNAPNVNWFGCNIHTNEIQYEKSCKRIFISSGKSEMHVIDVSNPFSPDSCNYYGGVSDSIGTWGISLWQNEIFLSYICAIIPFTSNWTGVKILVFEPCTTSIKENRQKEAITFIPNPFAVQTILQTKNNLYNGTLEMENVLGQTVKEINNIHGNKVVVKRDNLPGGIYIMRLFEGNKIINTRKVIITD